MEGEKKRNFYGDNYLDEYFEDNPSYRDNAKWMPEAKIDYSAVIFGAGTALVITLICLVMAALWTQAVGSAVLDFSFLVDITLVVAVLIGSWRGCMRVKTMGLAHGALIGLVYSVTGILLLAVLLPINWFGALQTVLMAVGLGGLGGVIGFNYKLSKQSSTWRKGPTRSTQPSEDEYDDYFPRA